MTSDHHLMTKMTMSPTYYVHFRKHIDAINSNKVSALAILVSWSQQPPWVSAHSECYFRRCCLHLSRHVLTQSDQVELGNFHVIFAFCSTPVVYGNNMESSKLYRYYTVNFAGIFNSLYHIMTPTNE